MQANGNAKPANSMNPDPATMDTVGVALKQMTAAELASHARRVTPSDISRVTPEQIHAVLQSVDQRQLATVLQVMIDNHKMKEVSESMNTSAFESALGNVSDEHLATTAHLMHNNPNFQAEVVGAMNDAQRNKCTAAVETRRRAKKPPGGNAA